MARGKNPGGGHPAGQSQDEPTVQETVQLDIDWQRETEQADSLGRLLEIIDAWLVASVKLPEAELDRVREQRGFLKDVINWADGAQEQNFQFDLDGIRTRLSRISNSISYFPNLRNRTLVIIAVRLFGSAYGEAIERAITGSTGTREAKAGKPPGDDR